MLLRKNEKIVLEKPTANTKAGTSLSVRGKVIFPSGGSSGLAWRKKGESEWNYITLNSNYMTAMISGLVPGGAYEICFWASAIGGEREMSEILTMKTIDKCQKSKK